MKIIKGLFWFIFFIVFTAILLVALWNFINITLPVLVKGAGYGKFYSRNNVPPFLPHCLVYNLTKGELVNEFRTKSERTCSARRTKKAD